MLLVRRRNQRADGPGAVDALIMTLGLALVSGIFLIAPYVHDNTLALLPKLVSIGYPIGDIILLAAAIRLAVDAGKRRPAFYLLIAAIVSLLVTDDIYGLLTLHNAYNHQLWLDAGLDLLLPVLGRGRAAPVDAGALRGGGRSPAHG